MKPIEVADVNPGNDFVCFEKLKIFGDKYARSMVQNLVAHAGSGIVIGIESGISILSSNFLLMCLCTFLLLLYTFIEVLLHRFLRYRLNNRINGVSIYEK